MKYGIVLFFLLSVFACKTESLEFENLSIKDDVAYLADDQLEGRQTGTQGEKAAAEYIANRFEALGLQPKGTDNYYQTFSFWTFAVKNEKYPIDYICIYAVRL